MCCFVDDNIKSDSSVQQVRIQSDEAKKVCVLTFKTSKIIKNYWKQNLEQKSYNLI